MPTRAPSTPRRLPEPSSTSSSSPLSAVRHVKSTEPRVDQRVEERALKHDNSRPLRDHGSRRPSPPGGHQHGLVDDADGLGAADRQLFAPRLALLLSEGAPARDDFGDGHLSNLLQALALVGSVQTFSVRFLAARLSLVEPPVPRGARRVDAFAAMQRGARPSQQPSALSSSVSCLSMWRRASCARAARSACVRRRRRRALLRSRRKRCA